MRQTGKIIRVANPKRIYRPIPVQLPEREKREVERVTRPATPKKKPVQK